MIDGAELDQKLRQLSEARSLAKQRVVADLKLKNTNLFGRYDSAKSSTIMVSLEEKSSLKGTIFIPEVYAKWAEIKRSAATYGDVWAEVKNVVSGELISAYEAAESELNNFCNGVTRAD